MMDRPPQNRQDGERECQQDEGGFSGVQHCTSQEPKPTSLQLVNDEEDVDQGQVEHRRLK
jgi:hypothetical protein